MRLDSFHFIYYYIGILENIRTLFLIISITSKYNRSILILENEMYLCRI